MSLVQKQLGVPVAASVDTSLRQIASTEGIPFSDSLPKAPDAINVGLMTEEQVHAELQAGYDDFLAVRVQDAEAALADLRKHLQR
ncbi:MAG: type II toxin-antitoxin system RelB/DinJ family antitoxin [Duodenibacillus sp.]|nr:type II toxin-antitoxin system RelB/DinJ family antitoxin [Duodenibacillus sp.]